jgi:hypothetical protein
MKAQLKELAIQAKLPRYLLEYGTELCVAPHLEKFAQLIVRECAQVCLAQRDPANLNYKPSEKFAEAVKQHFGVEE